MKKLIHVILIAAVLFLAACGGDKKQDKEMSNNPFFNEFDTPFGVPDFEKIKLEHYIPAFYEGMKLQLEEVDAIIENKEEPNFENTIVAYDNCGQMLDRVNMVFDNLNEANTSDEMQAIADSIIPLLTQHQDKISMNNDFFLRIKAVYEKKESFNLNTEQLTVLTNIYNSFVRSGANLNDEDKEALKKINTRMADLTKNFGKNVLKETIDYMLVVDNKADLDGLPITEIDKAAKLAEDKGQKGKWAFTTQKPSMIPFLTYVKNRELRKELHTAYIMRGNNNNEFDNKEIIAEIVNLRVQKAHLLGFKSYADYVLDDRMAKNQANVYALLKPVWEAALPMAKKEAEELQKMIDREGGNFKLAHSDWWYYAEKLRKEKYDLDEAELRQYFILDNVLEGVFKVAEKLYGIQFKLRDDINAYQEDVKVFEVTEADGQHIGIVFYDPYTRESKRPGAWMTSFRKQSKRDGKNITPVIEVVTNFAPPTGDENVTISYDDVSTLFHEFGHCLHGLLSKCTYNAVSGTSVKRDFVELPSQIMENWAAVEEGLKLFAINAKGDTIPDELIQKIQESGHFNQGFATTEFMAAALLDMAYHTIEAEVDGFNVHDFEVKTLTDLGLIDEIIVRYRSQYFLHIFSGGYATGYYGYTWAEVYDADAFEAFKEKGVFDKETATSFRKNILEKGGSDDAMKLYIQFRGQEPTTEALLKRKGLN